jgi:CheY-like chemotaxis protein
MLQRMVRSVLGAGLLALAFAGGVQAQDYVLPYNKTPETPREFWAALKYELELGNHKRAAEMLKGFYERATAIADEDEQKTLFLGLYDREGMSFFLKLANLPELRKVTAKDGEKDRPIGEILTQRIGRLVEARLGDPARIKFFIENLSKSPEERAYAITQLRAAGPRAMPYLISVLRNKDQEKMHQAVFTAMLKMNSDIGPAALAALDVPEGTVRELLIELFVRRGDDRVVPHLWFLAGVGRPEDKVRLTATAALSKFLRTPARDLGEPKVALTRESERFYKQEVDSPTMGDLSVWLWDDKAATLRQLAIDGRTALNKVEVDEYFAAYWAKKALEVDPAFRQAQVLFLSTTIESVYRKAAEKNQLEQPLSKLAPDLQLLLAETAPSLLESVLDRAMAENRTGVAVGAARALIPCGDWKLIRGGERATPVLIRALSYPDRRVQLAAAEAVLNVPTTDSFPGSARVVEVLKRAIASEPQAKALIVHPNTEAAQALAATARELGYQPIVAASGREGVRLAIEAGDLEVIFVDSSVMNPELPYFLSQIRSGPDTSGIPVVVTGTKEQEKQLKALEARTSRVKVLTPPPMSIDMWKLELGPFLSDRFRIALTDSERVAQAKIAVGALLTIAQRDRSGYDLVPAEAALLKALSRDDLAGGAAAVLANRAGRQSQLAMADVVVNDTRAAASRSGVARELRAHMQRHGVLLKPAQIDAIVKLAAAATDPALKEEASRLAASLRADAAGEGSRLRRFEPALPKPVEEAKP